MKIDEIKESGLYWAKIPGLSGYSPVDVEVVTEGVWVYLADPRDDTLVKHNEFWMYTEEGWRFDGPLRGPNTEELAK